MSNEKMGEGKTPAQPLGIGPQPPTIHSGRAAGPFAAQPHELDNPTARRARALQLAIETIRSVRDFSNYQVVHTASLFDRFLENGATPPVTQPSEEDDLDADV